MRTKRLLLVLFAVIMVIGLVPGAVLATEGTTNVAKVGETEYSTLASAVEAAEAGQTITLLADLTLTEKVTYALAEGVTLDLNGKTVTIKQDTAKFAGTNITIKNGYVSAYNSKTNYPLYIGDGTIATTATVEGITIANGGIYVKNKASATLKNNDISVGSKFKYAVIVEDKGYVAIESGTYFGGKDGYDIMCWRNNIVVTGGTFKRNRVESFVADGYTVVKNDSSTYTMNDNSTYTVREIIPVAEANGNKYETLQAAINDAQAGETVILLGDITEQVVINKSLTLNLGDFTITGNTEEAVLRIYSDVVDATIDVTINATTGGIVNNGTGYAIYAGADLEDNDGNVADAERTNLTINGGNYESKGTDCIKQIMGLCTINDGSYESSFGRTVINGERWYGSEFEINGGKFYEFNPACVSVWTGFNGKDQENNFYHQHDIIAAGKTAEYKDGWYTVVGGEYIKKVSTKSLCYPSLEAAINASVNMNDVANLGVITLLDDDTLTATVTLLKGTTLDLNGKTLSVAYGAFIEGNNITIKNGTVKCADETKEYALFIGEGSATVTDITVDGGVYVDNATVTLEDVNATAKSKRHAVVVLNGANVTINSGEYVATTNTSSKVVSADDASTVTINDGKFSKEPDAKHMADGKFAVYEDGWYVVSANQAVAEVNGKKYESLQDAINAAPTYYTVKLLADIEATEQIVINKSINLNLGEFTITGNREDAIVRIYSDIVDKKIDVTIEAATGGIVNNGTGYAIYAGEDLDGGNDAERSNLTINGGNYESKGTDCIKQIMGLCTIDGGSYKSSFGRTVLNGERWYGAEFKINGGTFWGFNPACVSVWTGFDGKNYDNFYHQHDIIAAGKTATYAGGWYTVVDGEYIEKVSTKSLCYPSLAAALDASANMNDVANLGVITLLADDTVATSRTFNLPGGLVIDLGGHTLTVPNQTIFKGNNITIKNGKIDYTGNKGAMDYVIFIGENSTATIEDVTARAGINVGANSKVTLINVEAMNYKKYYAVYASNGAHVDIMSGNYRPGSASRPNLYGDITVYGGTFMNMPEAKHLAADRHVVKHGAAKYTVYEGFQTALDAAEAGDTVYLMSDIAVAETVIINKSINLNLGEFTITGNSEDAIVRIYSDVVDTVISITVNATTGGIVNNGTGYAIYAGEDLAGGNDAERSNLTINGGNYESKGTDCIKQIMGRLTINDGSYKSSYGRTVLNGQRYYFSEFTITGGKFYGFNPACVSVWTGGNNGTQRHHHDIIAAGKTATYANGWYTVVDGTYTAKVSTQALCFGSVSEALNAVVAMKDVRNLGIITLLDNATLSVADIQIAMASYDESGNYLDKDAQLGSGLKFSFVLDGHTLTLPEGYELYDVTLDGNREVKMIRAISNTGISTDD